MNVSPPRCWASRGATRSASSRSPRRNTTVAPSAGPPRTLGQVTSGSAAAASACQGRIESARSPSPIASAATITWKLACMRSWELNASASSKACSAVARPRGNRRYPCGDTHRDGQIDSVRVVSRRSRSSASRSVASRVLRYRPRANTASRAHHTRDTKARVAQASPIARPSSAASCRGQPPPSCLSSGDRLVPRAAELAMPPRPMSRSARDRS